MVHARGPPGPRAPPEGVDERLEDAVTEIAAHRLPARGPARDSIDARSLKFPAAAPTPQDDQVAGSVRSPHVT